MSERARFSFHEGAHRNRITLIYQRHVEEETRMNTLNHTSFSDAVILQLWHKNTISTVRQKQGSTGVGYVLVFFWQRGFSLVRTLN